MAVEATKLQIPGAAPYGFRLYGGDGENLVVAKLRAQSKAYEVGLREGDVILGINGRSVQSISHGHASQLLEKSVSNLDLHIIRGVSDKEAINLAFQQLASQLRPPSPQLPPPQNGPASDEHILKQTATHTSTTVEVSASAPKLVTRELISEITVDGGASNQAPEFHIQNVAQSALGKHSQSAEIIVYRHIPNLSHYSQSSHASELSQEPPPAPRQRRPIQPTQTNAFVKPFVPQAAKENIPPYVPPPVAHYNREDASLLPPLVPPHNQQHASSSADFRITHTSATPWVWQPTNVQRVVSKPLTEFELDPVAADNDHYETIAKHSPYGLSKDEEEGDDEGRGAGSGGDDIPLHLIKILTCQEDIDRNAFKRKKIFADSMFYDDPEHKYPTIQEQIKMARMVAQSLTAPVNVTARGQRMFMKRKEKSSVWSIDSPGYHRVARSEDLYYNPKPWNSETKKSANVNIEWGKKVQIPPAFTKPKNKSIGKVGGAKARVSFGVSDELMRMKGKGGEMFSRRRAKSEETEDHSPSPLLKTFGSSSSTQVIVERPSSVVAWSGNIESEEERDLRPQSRLKEMIETNRTVCQSPWDSGIDYGLNISVVNTKPWATAKSLIPSRESQNDRVSSTFSHKSSRGYGPVSFKASQNFGSMPALNRGDHGPYTDF